MFVKILLEENTSYRPFVSKEHILKEYKFLTSQPIHMLCVVKKNCLSEFFFVYLNMF